MSRCINSARLPLAALLLLTTGGVCLAQTAETDNFAKDFAAAAAAVPARQFCEIVIQEMGVMTANVGATKLSL